MTTDQTAAGRAQDAAGTAADEGRHLAGTAKEEAQSVASEAATQARSVLDDAKTQLSSQSGEQKDRLAGTLRTLGEDLDSMAGRGTPGLASDLARQASDRVRTLGDHIESREPAELLDDVRRFARNRPGTFLLGALAAGVVVGRLVRGTADGIAAAEAAGPVTPSTPPAGTGATATATTPVTPVPAADPAPTGAPYVPSPSTETGPAHGQPTRDPDDPAAPPMARPEAGYGERGVYGEGL